MRRARTSWKLSWLKEAAELKLRAAVGQEEAAWEEGLERRRWFSRGRGVEMEQWLKLQDAIATGQT